MKVNVEEITAVKKTIRVEIPEGDVDRELNAAYKDLKQNVKIKGFRPGKVPMSLLESRFKKEIQAEVSGKLIQNSYGQALEKTDFKPVGEPSIDSPDLEKGKPFTYSITFEVVPPMDDLVLQGLKGERKVRSISEEEIEHTLKALQKRVAQLKTVDEERPVQDNDIVIIDYEGFRDGKPFAEVGKTENFQLQIGSGQVLEDFSSQIVGMGVDSTKEISVAFPKDYYNKDLAGLAVDFKVTVKDIKEEVFPELDDEFAKDLGQYETLDELKEAIKENLEQKYNAASTGQLRKDVLDKLVEQIDVELPESLVQAELEALVEQARRVEIQKSEMLGESAKADEDIDKYRSMAERKVREYLVIQKIIEQENITLTEEDLEKAYAELSEAVRQPVETFKNFHKTSRDAYQMFRQKALEKVAVDRIIDKFEITEVEDTKRIFEDDQGEKRQT